jgi:manganese transport protein
MFTSDKAKMGKFISPLWMRGLAWAVSMVIAVLNAWMLYQLFAGA